MRKIHQNVFWKNSAISGQNLRGKTYNMKKRGKIGEILQKIILKQFKNFFFLNKSVDGVNIMQKICQKIFEKFRPFSAKNSEVKRKLPFWQHLFSSACIFGQKKIRPKNVFRQISKYTRVPPNKFLEVLDNNWASDNKIPWGGGTPVFPPYKSQSRFHSFLRKASKFSWAMSFLFHLCGISLFNEWHMEVCIHV